MSQATPNTQNSKSEAQASNQVAPHAEEAEAPQKVQKLSEDAAEPSEKPLPVGALYRKRLAFRRRLNNYKRIRSRIEARLDGKDVQGKEDEDKKSAEDKDEKRREPRQRRPLNKVIESYRLVRNLALTINWYELTRADQKNFIPAVIKQKLIDLLSEEVFNKFQGALEKPVSQYEEDLGVELQDSVI